MWLVGAPDVVGAVLVAGLVVFMVGAVAWRLEYERPLADSLPLIHHDRRRRTWIHLWMIPALFLTPAGLAGFTALLDSPIEEVAALMAAVVYAIGSVCFIVSLAFRLTVVPWAAEHTTAAGSPPDAFGPFNSWASALYVIYMSSAYAAFAALGVAVLASADLPRWLGWLGVAWGVGFLAGFVATRFAGMFNPPFWAHAYTGVLGVVLLVS
jgi:hypothetical protein